MINGWYPLIESIDDGAESGSKLVVIDDGSKDDTFKIMQKYAETHPDFVPITRPNAGHGATVLYGYNYAVKEKADYVFQTDSDGQTLPNEFKEFWKLRKDYDMVIGCRNARQDGKSRVFVSQILKLVIRICFGVTIIDANTPFRLMQVGTLKKYIGLIPQGFNLSNVILSVIYAKMECRVKFIPITFRPRQGGVNSIDMKKIFKIGRKAMKDFRAINHALKMETSEKNQI